MQSIRCAHSGLCLAVVCASLSPAMAALELRPHGLVYDTSTNTTWLQDPMYARTSGYDSDGKMTWLTAKSWVQNLVYAGFENWTFSTMPYYPNPGPMYELYFMSLGNPDWGTPTKRGLFGDRLEWGTYWIMPPSDGSGSTQNFYFEFGAGNPAASWPYSLEIEYSPTTTPHRAWAMRYGDVAAALAADYDHSMQNGDFSGASLRGWDVRGQGVVEVVSVPGTTNRVASMTTGSPVSLAQLLDTPGEAFQLALDFDLADSFGRIDVLLNGTLLGTLSGHNGVMTGHHFDVLNSALWGLTSTDLELRMYSVPNMSGIVGYVDNIRLIVPEPATALLVLLGGLFLRRSPAGI